MRVIRYHCRHAEDPAPYLAASVRTPRCGCPSCTRGFFVRWIHPPTMETTMSEHFETVAPQPPQQPQPEQERATYDVHAVQEKWRRSGTSWTRSAPTTTRTREKRYALTMFPYPSGDLHMGHAEVIALHDVVARYWWQRGYEVLNPMGFDSFGLPAENAAIRNDAHPATYTYANIETQRESFDDYGLAFDWSRTVQHQRPGVLPLDPVAVPEVPRARAGLPQEQPGQLVPQRPDRAGQRAGRRRRAASAAAPRSPSAS